MESSKYSVELVTPAGLLIADLSGRAMNRVLTKSRNEADSISWSLDLNEFERYCRLTGQLPQNVIIVDQTEVRIKRNSEYLSGGQINYCSTAITPDKQTIDIKASGFLNLFKDRYTNVERIFTGVQATTIAATAINETQALTNGNFGITIGTLATVGVHDRTYRRTEIKDLLQNLTRVQTNAFDMEFMYNKVFNTYVSIGSNRPDIIFEYPKNIKSFTIPLDGTGVANEITALGGGFGEEAQTQAIVSDLGSQASYALRQKIITPNGVTEQTNLNDHANAELAAWSFPFELPQITLDGNIAPFITDYGIGDYVRVIIKGYKWLDHVDRTYRIEKFDLKIDNEDNEEVVLYISA